MMIQMESLAQEMPKTQTARSQRAISGKNHPKPPLAVEWWTHTHERLSNISVQRQVWPPPQADSLWPVEWHV